MSRRRLAIGLVLSAVTVAAVLGRAVTAVSVGTGPLVYRMLVNNNDLDGVEGLATPGSVVYLAYRQRNFREGTPDGDDRFSWCAWKNGGVPIQLGWAVTNESGVFRLSGMRQQAVTVQLLPPGPGEDRCSGGVYTELEVRSCDGFGPNANCTWANLPTLDYLNVLRPSPHVAKATGAVTGAHQASISVADGPNDGPEASDVFDVDQNGLDTTRGGLVPGQRVEWRCGPGGHAVCPGIAVYDASTITAADPEYAFVLGTLQGHRPGGSVIAAAAVGRPSPLGFTVNVNVKLRGLVDINLGCDQNKLFDFSLPLTF